MAVPDRLIRSVLIAGLAAAAAGLSLAVPAVLAAQAIHPQWSPDGTRIAFHTNYEGEWGIYVMAADGAGAEPPTRISR